jgi:hypothetical protein
MLDRQAMMVEIQLAIFIESISNRIERGEIRKEDLSCQQKKALNQQKTNKIL